MATITINGKEHTFPRMKLKTMRKALPLVEKMQSMAEEPSTGASDEVDEVLFLCLRIVAWWLFPPPRGSTPEKDEEHINKVVDDLDNDLDVEEAQAMGSAIQNALQEHGYIQAPGEPEGAPSPATAPSESSSTESSQPSSPPDAAAEAGTL